MKSLVMTATLVAATAATPIVAQSIGGATVKGTFKQFTDDDFDNSATALQAGIDVGITPQFALGGTFHFSEIEDGDDSATGFTGRGMYMSSPNTAWGAFASAESRGDTDVNTYGAEFATGSNLTSFEAYYGVVDSDDLEDIEFTIAGFNFEFEVSPGFSLGLDYESYRQADAFLTTTGGDTFVDDFTLSDVAIIARYSFADGPSVFAEIGRISGSASNDDTLFETVNELEYVAVGAQYTFGRQTGALFSDRTFLGFFN